MFDIFTREGLIALIYTLPALLLSLSFHEYAHAWAAYKLGDTSQKIRGRMTLNPLAHIDWFGLISIILLGIGWGKPVMIDDRNFKNRGKGNMLTALAGPVANFILALICVLILKLVFVSGLASVVATNNVADILLTMVVTVVQFNLLFGLFNLIPIPPLDGASILMYLLPQPLKGWYYSLQRYSFLLILIIFFTDITSYIITPAYTALANLIYWFLSL